MALGLRNGTGRSSWLAIALLLSSMWSCGTEGGDSNSGDEDSSEPALSLADDQRDAVSGDLILVEVVPSSVELG